MCIFRRYVNRANTISFYSRLTEKPRFTPKSTPNTIFLSYSTIALLRPTNLRETKITFEFYFEFLNSIFFFLSPPTVSIFCLPADEATVKSIKNNSPTDSEKQTAIASKDKATFFDKAFALSNTNNVSEHPT